MANKFFVSLTNSKGILEKFDFAGALKQKREPNKNFFYTKSNFEPAIKNFSKEYPEEKISVEVATDGDLYGCSHFYEVQDGDWRLVDVQANYVFDLTYGEREKLSDIIPCLQELETKLETAFRALDKFTSGTVESLCDDATLTVSHDGYRLTGTRSGNRTNEISRLEFFKGREEKNTIWECVSIPGKDYDGLPF